MIIHNQSGGHRAGPSDSDSHSCSVHGNQGWTSIHGVFRGNFYRFFDKERLLFPLDAGTHKAEPKEALSIRWLLCERAAEGIQEYHDLQHYKDGN